MYNGYLCLVLHGHLPYVRHPEHEKIPYLLSTSSFLLILAIFIFAPSTHAAINSDFTPQWKIGDSWDVVTREIVVESLGISGAESIESSGPAVTIHFEVTSFKDIDGEACYVVKVTYKNPKAQYEKKPLIELYVRQSDFTLKKILDREVEKESNDHDFVIFIDSFAVPVPFDFPNFPITNKDEERTDSSGTMTQKIAFLGDTVTIELTKRIETDTLKTTQTWLKGKPWWSSVKRTYTYKDFDTGKIIKTRNENEALLSGPVKIDITPPVLSVTVAPTILWPPNHEMVEVVPTVTVTDDYDSRPLVELKITSNEPVLTQGAGRTDSDIQETRVWDHQQKKMLDKIFLRAERSGTGSGRIYTINYSATDFSGNAATASATVTVPHDMGDEKKK